MDKVNFPKRKFESLSDENSSEQSKIVRSDESLSEFSSSLGTPNCQITDDQARYFSNHHHVIKTTTTFPDELVDVVLLDQFNLLEACCRGDLMSIQRILSENEHYYCDINRIIMANPVIEEVWTYATLLQIYPVY